MATVTVPVIFVPRAPSNSSSSTPAVRRDKSLTPHQSGSVTTTQQQEWRPKPVPQKGSDGADPTIGLTFVGVICVMIIIGVIFSHHLEKDRLEREKQEKLARREAERKQAEENEFRRIFKNTSLDPNWREEMEELRAEQRSEERITKAIAHKKWLADAPRRKAEEDAKWAKWLETYPYK